MSEASAMLEAWDRALDQCRASGARPAAFMASTPAINMLDRYPEELGRPVNRLKGAPERRYRGVKVEHEDTWAWGWLLRDLAGGHWPQREG